MTPKNKYMPEMFASFKLDFVHSQHRTGFPEAEYRKFPALNQSFLKDINAVSPHNAEFRRDNRDEPTPAMRIGSLFHAMSLEPEIVPTNYAVMPEGIDRRTKTGKQEYDEFMLQSEGKTVLKRDEWDLAKNMSDAVLPFIPKEPFVLGNDKDVFEPEATFFGQAIVSSGTYEGTIVDLKARFDGHRLVTRKDSPPVVELYDLKSVADISDCKGASWKGNWAMQSAFYTDLAAHNLGCDVSFYYICVSKSAPYDVRRFRVSKEMLIKGRQEYTKAIAKWLWYINNGKPTTQEFFGVEELLA